MADETPASNDQNTPPTNGDGSAPRLPMFFNTVEPLNHRDHSDLCLADTPNFEFAKEAHLVPLLAEEFPIAQRFFPVVFDSQGIGQPIAIMGLRQGINSYVEDDGGWKKEVYIPAYIRRYPFMLARLRDGDEKLSLCIDPTAKIVQKAGSRKLFDGEEGSQLTKDILTFCERYERGVAQTRLFCEKLSELELLREGEAVVQSGDKPTRFSGFRIIDENKLRELKQKAVSEMNQNGTLAVIHAHLFSLSLFQTMVPNELGIGADAAPASS
ncbi:MAG: SapC family protein [Pseudomonadota bacterium]